MNTLFRLFVLAGLFCVSVVRAAEPAVPELRGVLITGAERRFALSVPGDNQTAWVAVGGVFAGWKLSDYRPSEDSLVLSRDGKDVALKLSTSKIAEADTKATLADAEAVIDKMKLDQMIGRMLEQQKQSMAGMMKKMLAGAKGVDQEAFAAYQSKAMGLLQSAMNPADMKADMTRIYSEVFTKGELQGLADFYDTPAGQAMIDKQPEIQQKTMELVMPRMMAVIPKIQRMAAEFAKEQAAAKPAAAPVAP